MHEQEKITKESFMWFSKVYIYYTNTKKPYSKLSPKEISSKKFKLTVPKLFIISKNSTITQEEIEQSLKNDPDTINFDESFKEWKSKEYLIYGSHPINIYDFKLLVNLFGVRLLRFI